jgi:hypothetical protein
MSFAMLDTVLFQTLDGPKRGQIRAITRRSPLLYDVLPEGENELRHYLTEDELQREVDLCV